MAMSCGDDTSRFNINKFSQDFNDLVNSQEFERSVEKLARTAYVIAQTLHKKDVTDEIREESKHTRRNGQYRIVARNMVYYMIYKTTYNVPPPDMDFKKNRPYFLGPGTDYSLKMLKNVNRYMKFFISLAFNQYAEQLRLSFFLAISSKQKQGMQALNQMVNSITSAAAAAAVTTASTDTDEEAPATVNGGVKRKFDQDTNDGNDFHQKSLYPEVIIKTELLFSDDDDTDDEFRGGAYQGEGMTLPSSTIKSIKFNSPLSSLSTETKKGKSETDDAPSTTNNKALKKGTRAKILSKLFLSLLMEMSQSKLMAFFSEKIQDRRFTYRAMLLAITESAKRLAKIGVPVNARDHYIQYVNDMLKISAFKEAVEALHSKAIEVEYCQYNFATTVNPSNDCTPLELKYFDKCARFTKSIYGYSTQTPIVLTTHSHLVGDMSYDLIKFTRDCESVVFDVRLINQVQLDNYSWKERLDMIPAHHLPRGFVKISPYKIERELMWTEHLLHETDQTYLYVKTSALGIGTFFVKLGRNAEEIPVLNKRHKELNKDQLYDNEVNQFYPAASTNTEVEAGGGDGEDMKASSAASQDSILNILECLTDSQVESVANHYNW